MPSAALQGQLREASGPYLEKTHCSPPLPMSAPVRTVVHAQHVAPVRGQPHGRVLPAVPGQALNGSSGSQGATCWCVPAWRMAHDWHGYIGSCQQTTQTMLHGSDHNRGGGADALVAARRHA